MMDSAPLPVTGYVDTISSTCVEGWAAFPACPERQVMVQAVLDGVVVGQGATREFRPDVQQALGLGAEMVGFRLELEIAPDRCPELEVLAFDGAVWTPLLRSSAVAVAPPAQMAPSDIDPDSFQRLVTLGLVGVEGGAFPLAPMRGKTVLILDAEGDMFHNEALRQGAARVVRHVIGDDRRHFARDGDPCLPRPLRAGSDLPEGRFDIIIFGDAGDISAYGRSIFADLALRLAPGGVLVLECLALPVGESSGFGFASLPIGAQHVVHLDYLVDGLLADFSVRIMGASPVRAGDVLPRYALRCMPW
ncbi:MAG: hypothetical protein MUF74_14535, partial [Cypionkella sp.]|nr:hypothetical protein [Cypionkella sp.]